MSTRRRILKSMAFGVAQLGVGRAHAEEDKSPITVLVGAATTMDATARMVSEQMASVLGRPVVTVSKLGAGGRLALAELRRSAPDGRTLMVAVSSMFSIYPNIYTRLDYDPAADFTPIAGVSWFDVGLATGPGTGPNGGVPDLRALLAWARRKVPDALYGAAPGNGSSSHFAGIAMSLASGVPMTMVPYKDSNIGIGDIISGRLPMLITGTGAMTEMHKVGKLRLLATSGLVRTPLVGDVPTFKETGLDVEVVNSVGLFGPARMPRDLVARLAAVIDGMLGNADQRSRLLAMGMTPLPMAAPELAASLVQDRKRYASLVKQSGFVPEAS